jgi:hypothetical protein
MKEEGGRMKDEIAAALGSSFILPTSSFRSFALEELL